MGTAITLDENELPPGLGRIEPKLIPATAYRQGGRQMYSFVLTLEELTNIIRRPDPDQPVEGNRLVDPKRSAKFADYIITEKRWVAPAIIFRGPAGDIAFRPAMEFDNGTSWGTLEIPLKVLTELLILDGQHRTLGTFIAFEESAKVIREKADILESARRIEDAAMVAQSEKALAEAKELRDRLSREHISVDLALVTTTEGSQMFVDIADNAKGVNRDFTVALDQRDIVNRIAADLIEKNELLHDRVEIGQSSRMTMNNPNLIGAKGVSDIVRTVLVGINGRVGRGVAAEIETHRALSEQHVNSFLGALVGGIPELIDLMNGDLDPRDLRNPNSGRASLIGSQTMLRVLAGVFHELVMGDSAPMSAGQFEDFLRELSPRMREVPMKQDNSLWIGTGAFLPEAMAPMARQGSLRQLVNALKSWAIDGIPS